MTDDLQAILRYAEIKQHGSLDDLRSIIVGAFGHCDDTARQRINYLISSKTIIPFGKQWKFNKTGFEAHQADIRELIALRDAGAIQQKEVPKETEDEKDRRMRAQFRAKQE